MNDYSRDTSRMLQSVSAEFSNQRSGGTLPEMYLAIVDKYGQVVSTDDSSTLTMVVDADFNTNVSYSAGFEGNAIYTPTNGMFHI